MAKQLAWIRSKNATDMMSLLNERMAECVARDVPDTVARGDGMASPARARGRTDAVTAATHAVINGAALGVPRLPGVNEGAEVTATAPHGDPAAAESSASCIRAGGTAGSTASAGRAPIAATASRTSRNLTQPLFQPLGVSSSVGLFQVRKRVLKNDQRRAITCTTTRESHDGVSTCPGHVVQGQHVAHYRVQQAAARTVVQDQRFRIALLQLGQRDWKCRACPPAEA